MAESDNLLTRLQDLLAYLIPQLNKFPRDQKFVLGDRIESKLLDVQEDCLRAYYSRDKRGHLLEANLQLEVARHLVRLANVLKLFSTHTYGVLAEKMDEVGRMIGGWLKSVTGMRASFRYWKMAAKIMCSPRSWSQRSMRNAGRSAI
jgi:hypothetical protein